MNAKERLLGVQAALNSRGVRDVKFCFAKDKTVPMSHVREDVAGALQAFIDGKFHSLPPAGDTLA
jgi:hypothetical protein